MPESLGAAIGAACVVAVCHHAGILPRVVAALVQIMGG
jgi:hypothetical protein